MRARLALARLAVALLACAATLPAQAPDLHRRIDDAVTRVSAQLIAVRQQIHQNPELGNREFETAKTIAAHLRALGLEVTTGVAHTGVVAILRGGKPGPVVAVRSDMDALPVTEASGTRCRARSVARTWARTWASRTPAATTSTCR